MSHIESPSSTSSPITTPSTTDSGQLVTFALAAADQALATPMQKNFGLRETYNGNTGSLNRTVKVKIINNNNYVQPQSQSSGTSSTISGHYGHNGDRNANQSETGRVIRKENVTFEKRSPASVTSSLNALERSSSRSSYFSSFRSAFESTLRIGPKLNSYSILEIKDVKKYLPPIPNKRDKKFLSNKTQIKQSPIPSYFCSNHLVQYNVIPIWDPTPTRGNELERVRIDVGDVGTITELGGFRVAYNILMDEETNRSCGYNVPPNFSQFIPPVSGRKSIEITNVVNLDNCGAFETKKIETSRPFFNGFKHYYLKSFRDQGPLQLKISPEEDIKNRGYIILPDGAKIFSFSNLCNDALVEYLKEYLPSWLDHLEGLRQKWKAPPILLTSVWAARLFASAAYISPTKKQPRPTAELWKLDPKGDKLHWESRPDDGFTTMVAPLGDGFDKEGKIISKVENQCFAIQGYVFPPNKMAQERIGQQST